MYFKKWRSVVNKNAYAAMVLFVLAAAAGIADDGGSQYPEDWTYGNIYVKEPNTQISLEKELLMVEQLNNCVEAVFDFKNTVQQTLTVPCAFPVVITMPYAVEDGNVQPNNRFNSQEDLVVWQIALKKQFSNGNFSVTADELAAADKKLRVVSVADYAKELVSYGENEKSVSQGGKEPAVYNGCVIEQDGKNIPLQTVGIETTVGKDSVKLVLHFYHELSFMPSAESKVTVRYKIDTVKEDYRGNHYCAYYDISTGGTWKGAMTSFVVFTDSSMSVSGTGKTDFECSALAPFDYFSEDSFKVYAVQNYKPGPSDYFKFDVTALGDECSGFPSDRKPQDFVKNIRSSSFLQGTFKMGAGNSSNYDDGYTWDETLRTSSYEQQTSFDGILDNGWVEGSAGDGSGEWIEFTLTKAALGPFATNGLARFSKSDMNSDSFSADGFENEQEYEKYISTHHQKFLHTIEMNGESYDSTWKSNNRIRSMMLHCTGAKEDVKLDFSDLFPARSFHMIDGWLSANSIKNPQLLSTGTYRMTIQSVYKGEKWNDTVLGEVWFYELGDVFGTILAADDSSPLPIYRVPITESIQRYVKKYDDSAQKETTEYGDN
jgi:hypothetical protein